MSNKTLECIKEHLNLMALNGYDIEDINNAIKELKDFDLKEDL